MTQIKHVRFQSKPADSLFQWYRGQWWGQTPPHRHSPLLTPAGRGRLSKPEGSKDAAPPPPACGPQRDTKSRAEGESGFSLQFPLHLYSHFFWFPLLPFHKDWGQVLVYRDFLTFILSIPYCMKALTTDTTPCQSETTEMRKHKTL